MIRAIVSRSLHNRLIVPLGAMGLVGVGTYSAMNLNVKAYPDPTPPLVDVFYQHPGPSSEVMAHLVGTPIETALNGQIAQLGAKFTVAPPP